MLTMSEKNYHQKVYEITKQIPFGRVSTYGTIANFLELGSARMVGWALNKSFTEAGVPAHRVVNRKGELSGRVHFPTPTMMQELLENEGIKVVDNKVENFNQIYWDPANEK